VVRALVESDLKIIGEDKIAVMVAWFTGAADQRTLHRSVKVFGIER
jgi:hypothetical protein